MKNTPITLGGGLALLLLLLSMAACVHPPVQPIAEPDPDPDPAQIDSTVRVVEECHPDTLYYVQQIQPMLNSNCAFSGCHNESSARAGVVLTTYGNLLTSDIVEAGDPADSKLYEVITEPDPAQAMPPNAPLTTEQIAMIDTWIRQGAQNLSCEDLDCDTTNVTYSGYVRPWLDLHCTGCHVGVNAGGGVFLSGFGSVQEVALNGQFLGSIQHDAGFSPMPKGEDKLADCDITKIKLWIEDGAPNN